MSKQSDNSNLAAKLAIRRHMLDRYPDSPRNVLDCCAGVKTIWTQLRKEYKVGQYLPFDLQVRSGTVRMNSIHALANAELVAAFDVIDIDTYGSPWPHWLAMLPHVRSAKTVFLTIGKCGGRKSVTNAELAVLGIGRLPVPQALRWKLAPLVVSYCLTRSYGHGILIKDAVETTAINARYLGLRLEMGG